MKFKVVKVEIKDGIVDLPTEVIPLEVGLMFIKPLTHPLKSRDCVKCLVPIKKGGEQDGLPSDRLQSSMGKAERGNASFEKSRG